MNRPAWVATFSGFPLYTAPGSIPGSTWVGTHAHGIALGIQGMTPYFDTFGPFVKEN